MVTVMTKSAGTDAGRAYVVFGRSDGIHGKAVNQRPGHFARCHFKRRTSYGSTRECVFQHVQVNALLTRALAQLGHFRNLRAAIFSHDERLRVNYLRFDFVNDRGFLSAIQTQVILLFPRVCLRHSRAGFQRPCRIKIPALPQSCPNDPLTQHTNLIQRDRHLRWPGLAENASPGLSSPTEYEGARQRSWMTH